MGGYGQWLEQAGRVKILCLVMLTYRTATDKAVDHAVSVGVVERRSQPVEGLLCSLVADVMGLAQQLRLAGHRADASGTKTHPQKSSRPSSRD